MKKEFQVIGPPGTGKTTFLTKQVARSCEEYGSEAVLITSLTRSAAAEIAGRDLPIPKENVGTLHSFCFRALGSPKIAELNIKKWNEDNPDKSLSMPEGKDVSDGLLDEASHNTVADALLQEVNLLRAYMVDQSAWPDKCKQFSKRWEAWKQENEFMDFTDLIANGIKALSVPDKKVIIADEVQDYSKLEMTLIRKIGERDTVEKFILAGDSDQLLYEWRGADPELFKQEWVTPENRRVLKKSWRVPEAIHRVAKRWIEKIKDREPIEYEPKDAQGEVERASGINCMNKYQYRLLEQIRENEKQRKRSMILTSCGYMLQPIISALRKEGILYHNPYRKNRGDWNPLTRKGISAVDRILAWTLADWDIWGKEARMWTVKDLQIAFEHMESKKLFLDGRKKEFLSLRDSDAEATISQYHFCKFFNMDKLNKLFDMNDTDEFLDTLMASKRKSYEYPMTIVKKQGFKRLKELPTVIVGSIHSVKGGEADIVYLFPDLSQKAAESFLSAKGKNAIYRTFYVGMTRAKEKLVLCNSSGPNAVEWSGIW